MDIDEIDVRTRAALAKDLVDKIDLAITTLDLKSVRDVRSMLKGMTEAADDVIRNGMPEED